MDKERLCSMEADPPPVRRKGTWYKEQITWEQEIWYKTNNLVLDGLEKEKHGERRSVLNYMEKEKLGIGEPSYMGREKKHGLKMKIVGKEKLI